MRFTKKNNELSKLKKQQKMKKEKTTQVSFSISLELKKAVDLYCVLNEIKRQDYFKNLVESDKKINQTK